MAARVVFIHDLSKSLRSDELKKEGEAFGKKVGDLINLISHGFEVAQSFVITHEAYLDFLQENNLENKIKHLVSHGLDREIKKHLDEAKLPESLINEILKAYKSLGTALEDIEVNINGEKIKGDAAFIEKIRQLFISSSPTKKVNIIVRKIHFGKHGRVRTSSKFINSIHPFTDSETILLENMLSDFKKIFYIPHEIDFTLEKGKIIINSIKPETHVQSGIPLSDTGYRVIVNSHY